MVLGLATGRAGNVKGEHVHEANKEMQRVEGTGCTGGHSKANNRTPTIYVKQRRGPLWDPGCIQQ